jgi:hypothetical protein
MSTPAGYVCTHMVPLHTSDPLVLKHGQPMSSVIVCTGVPVLQLYQLVVHR